MRRWLIILLAVPVVAVVTLLVVIQHEFALKWVADKIVSSSNGSIILNGVSGSLTGTMKVEEAVYLTPERKISAEEVEISWWPSRILLGQLGVESVTVSRLTIESGVPSDAPFTLPESLVPPLSIHVGKVQVDQLTYDALRFQDVRLSLDANKAAWELKEAGFESPFGIVSAELKLGTHAPFSLDGKATVNHEKAEGTAQVAGDLHDIRFEGQFAGFGAEVKANAKVTPFAGFILPSLSLNAKNVDPSQVSADWPQSRIQATAEIQTKADESVAGSVRIDNTIPGTIDANRLPLRTVTARMGGNTQIMLLEQLVMDMGAAGQFSGNGRLSLDGVDLSLRTGRFDLSGIHSSIRKTAISGNIAVSAEEKKQVMTVKLAESRLALDARVIHASDRLDLPLFRLRAANGEIQLEGSMGLTLARDFSFDGKASRFNLSALGAYPSSEINATIAAKGHLSPEWHAAINYALQPSRFLDNPLTGKGRFTVTATALRDVEVLLALGPNSFNANGAFGKAGESLRWKLDAPKLAALGKPFEGTVAGEGTLSGTFEALQAKLKLDGSDLAFPGPVRAKSIHADGRFGTRPADLMDVRIDARNLAAADMLWSALQFQANGTLQAHSLEASAQNNTMDLYTRAAGGWKAKQGWGGEIQALENKGKQPFSLASPAPLHAGTRLFSLQDFTLTFPDGRLVVNKLEKRGSRIRSDGYAKGFPLRYLTAFAPALRQKVGGQLVFGAEWSVDMDRMLTGKVHVYRESGDLTIRGDTSVKLGLTEMDMRLNLAKNELDVLANIKGETTGVIQLTANAQLVRNRNGWHFPKQSPFRLQLDADMPTLDWVSVVSGQPDIDINGSLKVKINGAGTIGDPRLTGTFAGNALSFRWYTWGVKLHDGQLLARLDNNRVTLEQATIRGDEGVFRMEGGGSFDHGNMHINLSFLADKLLLLSSPDKQLALSGQGQMTLDNEKMTLNGKWRVDKALIQSVEYNNVNFSDDVVVLGREDSASESKKPMAVAMDMTIDLGDRFRIDGWGLDARLEGNLQVASAEDQSLRVFGKVQAVNATFNAYGQKLTVERGNVVFSGPAERPSLDILAIRKVPTFGMEDAVEAGVQVRGTPQNLQVKLVSNPNVSDSEKLSWLILGHGGAQSANDHDRSVVAAAAAALLSTSSLGSMQSGLASTIGVDEIGVGAGADMESTVLSVSKQISNRLYLTYEQGISTVSNLVKLRYIVSQRVRVEAATGTSSAIDLLYEWSFD
ncbi:translocation/assembly module TamB domain-containing protein [Oxalobacter vibrioformis]|uniref:Translocation/assembly module TamB domain-containing protein n=1 Tax=Oxalobacter vibrioformis TaxID=933080 RepID=A0A9E9LXQ1_9BURK|nr:translocation/assembly module TamB domain-containing protein [Oxalobacter vibrioformis]WAW11181.1 translocation/assembly module TamB domain-containing protein [Oxalobacter vibrioformis]